jgi:two-component system, NarL family, nitrate/nitrite response regulator NarL
VTSDLISVGDAAEAVRNPVPERPHGCLLHSRMPDSDVAAARDIAGLAQAKIMMLTASEEDADLFAALRAGRRGYLLRLERAGAAGCARRRVLR